MPDFVGRTESKRQSKRLSKTIYDTRNLLSTILAYESLTVLIGAQMFFDVSFSRYGCEVLVGF